MAKLKQRSNNKYLALDSKEEKMITFMQEPPNQIQ